MQVLGVSCMKQTSLQFFFILSIWIHSYYVRSAGPWTNFYKVQNTRRVFLAYIFPDFTSVTLKQQHSDQFEPQIRRQMSLGTYLYYKKWILGCGLGWTVKKGLNWLWATFEAFFFKVFINLKFFWKYCRDCTEKFHRIMVNKSHKNFGKYFLRGENQFFRAKNLRVNTLWSVLCLLLLWFEPLLLRCVFSTALSTYMISVLEHNNNNYSHHTCELPSFTN